jgi:hypothetical protein
MSTKKKTKAPAPETFPFNAGPEMNACVAEMGEMLEKWEARANTRPEEMDGFMVVHTAVLQAYALWFTTELEPGHTPNVLSVRDAITEALNEPAPAVN